MSASSLLPIVRTGQTLSDVKSQPVRLADIVFVGPVMIGGGLLLARKGNPLLGGLLSLMGAGTIAYNARNYELVERRLRGR